MAMLLTICLISTTIYVAIEAPPLRGMSYVEVWIVAMEIPSLVAIFETGYLLLKYRKQQKISKNAQAMQMDEVTDVSVDLRLYDVVTGSMLFGYFILFQIIYWSITLSL